MTADVETDLRIHVVSIQGPSDPFIKGSRSGANHQTITPPDSCLHLKALFVCLFVHVKSKNTKSRKSALSEVLLL